MHNLRAEHDVIRPVGVLLVLGVGGRQRSPPIFGEQIYLWLTRWLGGGASLEPVSGLVKIDTTPTTARNGDAPEHFSMRRAGSDRAVLVAESRWAQDVAGPTFTELAQWMLGLGPWVVEAYFTKRAQQLRAFALSLGDAASTSFVGSVLFALYGLYVIAALFVLVFVFVFVGLMLGVVLQVVMFGLLVLGVLPRLRGLVSGAQLKLTGSLGDVYLLASSPVRFAKMIQRVRADIDWMAGMCDDIIVVAHSQGAAVAREAMPGDQSVRAFITAGTAEQKLHWARMAIAQGESLLWSATLRTLGVAALAGSAVTDWPSPSAILLGAGVIGFLVGLYLSAPKPPELTAQELRFPCVEGIRWRDYYASADPVPDGPLLREPPTWLSSTSVNNRGSVLFDHSSYVRNPEEFVSVIAREAADRAEWNLKIDPEPVLSTARYRRSHRVEALVAEKLVAAAALAFAVWGLWDWLPDLGQPLAAVGGFFAGALPEIKASDAEAFLQRGGPDVITGVLAFGLLLEVWRLAVSGTAWRVWDVAEATRMFEHRPGQNLAGRPWIFAALGAVPALVVAALSVVAHDPRTEGAVFACGVFAIITLSLLIAPVNEVQRAKRVIPPAPIER